MLNFLIVPFVPASPTVYDRQPLETISGERSESFGGEAAQEVPRVWNFAMAIPSCESVPSGTLMVSYVMMRSFRCVTYSGMYAWQHTAVGMRGDRLQAATLFFLGGGGVEGRAFAVSDTHEEYLDGSKRSIAMHTAGFPV